MRKKSLLKQIDGAVLAGMLVSYVALVTALKWDGYISFPFTALYAPLWLPLVVIIISGTIQLLCTVLLKLFGKRGL